MIELTPEQIIEKLREELAFSQRMRDIGQQNMKTLKADYEARLTAHVSFRKIAEERLEEANQTIKKQELKLREEKTRADDNYDAWNRECDARRLAQKQRDEHAAKLISSDDNLFTAKRTTAMIEKSVNTLIDKTNASLFRVACLEYAITKTLKHGKAQDVLETANFVQEYPPDNMQLPEAIHYVTDHTT